MIYVLDPLSEDEQIALNHHLRVIKQSFIAMIRSLAYIHKNRLYRGNGGRTWAQFCEDELNYSPRYGNYLVSAFTILETIETHNGVSDETLPLPTNEAQTRALSVSKQADVIIETWRGAVARGGVNAPKRVIIEVYNELVSSGVNKDTAQTLARVADTKTGDSIITELLTSGYLQTGDEDETIPLADVRSLDVTRYINELRRETIMQRVAQDGGVNVTIYPDNPARTAKALLAHMTTSQAYELSILLEDTPKSSKLAT